MGLFHNYNVAGTKVDEKTSQKELKELILVIVESFHKLYREAVKFKFCNARKHVI